MIRRNIKLQTVAEATAPRWVSRPQNLGVARSSGVSLDIKGQADQLLASLWDAAPKALRLRATLSIYRSALEQVDDPDARVDGQAPWRASLGLDQTVPGLALTFGGQLAVTPAFATQRTDRQRVWRNGTSRLDAYVSWRQDALRQWRLALSQLVATDSLSSSYIDDIDRFAAGSQTRRHVPATLQLGLTWRL